MEAKDEEEIQRPTSAIYFSLHVITKLPRKPFLLFVLGWVCARHGGHKVYRDLFLLSQRSLSR